MTQLDRLKRRIPEEADTALLLSILDEAENFILAYTGRKSLPYALEGAQLQLAVMYYNRLGNEGESQRTEGGVSRAMESVPEQIRAQLSRYRLAKAGWRR